MLPHVKDIVPVVFGPWSTWSIENLTHVDWAHHIILPTIELRPIKRVVFLKKNMAVVKVSFITSLSY
jgi:hypothetical protein